MEHVRLGFNYRMSEMQAAVGCAQLERLDELLDRRSNAAETYHEALAPLSDMLHRPKAAPAGTRSWFVYVVRLPDDAPTGARDRLVRQLKDRGIGSAPYFPSIHLQPFYREHFGYEPGTLPVTERVAERTLALPFFAGITHVQIERVTETLQHVLPPILDPAPSRTTPAP
jgi:perosamine synthetase